MTTTAVEWSRKRRLGVLRGLIAVATVVALLAAGAVVVRAFRHFLPPDEEAAAPPPPAPGQVAPPAAAPPAPEDPLVVLNQSFRTAYRQARADKLAHAGPLILASGDTLVLFRDGQRTEAEVTPPAYHALKAVDHVPLALYVQLAPAGDGPLDETRVAGLRRYRELVAAARGSLEGRGFSPDSRRRQEQILAASLAFLDGILERRQVQAGELSRFTREAGPLVLANADEAARMQLDALHAQTTAWRRQMTPEEWQRLRVVVVGSAMPRKQNLAVQYFARLLGEPGEGRRLVYAEALWEEQKALDLLGTHLLDTDVGDAFFGDPRRMHRDLLADAAAAHLQRMTFGP
jgi:hypothetical protein